MSIVKFCKLSLIAACLFLTSCDASQRIRAAVPTDTPLPDDANNPPATSPIQDFTLTPSLTLDASIVQEPSGTPSPTKTQTLAQAPACDDPNDINLLSSPLTLEGTAGTGAEPPQPFQDLRPDALLGKDVLKVVIDIHGKRYGAGIHYDESAIIIEQPSQTSNGTWKVVSIVWYKNDQGQEVNGVDGKQTIYIPLADFIGLDQEGNVDNSHLNLEKPAGPIHFRFWNADNFTVDIESVVACNSQPGK